MFLRLILSMAGIGNTPLSAVWDSAGAACIILQGIARLAGNDTHAVGRRDRPLASSAL
ncbi:hypothetical protein [Streptomyces sp. NPDC048643]|uniref:hypothetical protein n=1 Tax=Streptomyces sp. NPDC048643 TaxID=3155637 RepID=UPI00343F2625